MAPDYWNIQMLMSPNLQERRVTLELKRVRLPMTRGCLDAVIELLDEVADGSHGQTIKLDDGGALEVMREGRSVSLSGADYDLKRQRIVLSPAKAKALRKELEKARDRVWH